LSVRNLIYDDLRFAITSPHVIGLMTRFVDMSWWRVPFS